MMVRLTEIRPDKSRVPILINLDEVRDISEYLDHDMRQVHFIRRDAGYAQHVFVDETVDEIVSISEG